MNSTQSTSTGNLESRLRQAMHDHADARVPSDLPMPEMQSGKATGARRLSQRGLGLALAAAAVAFGVAVIPKVLPQPSVQLQPAQASPPPSAANGPVSSHSATTDPSSTGTSSAPSDGSIAKTEALPEPESTQGAGTTAEPATPTASTEAPAPESTPAQPESPRDGGGTSLILGQVTLRAGTGWKVTESLTDASHVERSACFRPAAKAGVTSSSQSCEIRYAETSTADGDASEPYGTVGGAADCVSGGGFVKENTKARRKTVIAEKPAVYREFSLQCLDESEAIVSLSQYVTLGPNALVLSTESVNPGVLKEFHRAAKSLTINK